LVLLQSTPDGCLSSSHTKWRQLKQRESQINKTEKAESPAITEYDISICLSQWSTNCNIGPELVPLILFRGSKAKGNYQAAVHQLSQRFYLRLLYHQHSTTGM
jgi:hypothetical protein